MILVKHISLKTLRYSTLLMHRAISDHQLKRIEVISNISELKIRF